LAFGFGSPDLRPFLSSNRQSRRVIEKCGFCYVKNGTFFARSLQQDVADMKYILLRSDWERGGKSDGDRHSTGST
jgi:hypothetical protein